MDDDKTTIEEVKNLVKEFCDERDWRQYHDAKELAIGISTEAGELLQHFRFKSKEQIDELFNKEDKKEEIIQEVSDVFYFLLRFAEVYNIDLTKELKKKIKINDEKYPKDKVKGCNKKYSEYD